MIYLVTENPDLMRSDKYKVIPVSESLELLEKLKIVGFDTETEGLDCHTKRLLSMQFGCSEFQVVVDCLTVNPLDYKTFLESEEHLFLGWNLKFDLKFLFNYHIVPVNCYDGFLAEKLLWLGYPPGIHSLSLKAAGENYLQIELDKSIRGQIIYKGLVEEVIEYAADDVKYLEQIIRAQREELKKKGLLTAIEVENSFLLPLSYTEWCGVKLDVDKWKAKMVKDKERENKAKEVLNEWLIQNLTPDNKEFAVKTVKAYPVDLNDEGAAALGVNPLYQWRVVEGSKVYALPEDAELVKDNTSESVDEYGRNVITGSREFMLVNKAFVEQAALLRKKYIIRNLQGDLFTGFNTDEQVVLNWNSTQQMVSIFKLFGIDVIVEDKATGGKKDSIDAKVLKPQKKKCSLIPLYLEYCKAVKVTSTYGDNFLKQINPATHRIHTNFQQMGADTTRITSGGKDRAGRVEYVNLLNLPKDEETRSCFIAEDGNKWISIDYSGQETYLMASISNDKAILDELINGSGDIHSLTAYISYPEIPRNITIPEIKKKYPELRQDAKGIEFAINYGGDASTISQNKNIPINEAREIYNNYMSGFNGLQAYQKFRRKDWIDKGYILLSDITGHKAFIPDMQELLDTRKRMHEPGFWDYYRELKQSNPNSDTVQMVRRFFRKKSSYERASINYPIQAGGSMCLRTATTLFFKYLRENNLLFKVLIMVLPYDEVNCEAPAEIADEIADKLHECMVKGGSYFCTRCKLDADISYQEDGTLPNHWVH